MKKLILCLLGTLALMACNNNSYSNKLKAEKKLIESYMNVHGYTITDELPAEGTKWADNLYYRIPVTSTDYCFFRLEEVGDTTVTVSRGRTVVLRYSQYTLTEPADTLNRMTTMDSPFPIEFRYLSDNTGASCTGWQYAIGLMKHPESKAKLIVPSKLGFTEEQSSVTPFGYDLVIKGIK